MLGYKDYNKYTSGIDYSLIIAFFLQNGKLKHYKKGDSFIRVNDQGKYMGYVISGVFQYRGINAAGGERVVGYSFQEGFVGNYPAFIHRHASTIEIRALCDCSVYVITYDELMRFYEANNDQQALRWRVSEILLLEVYDRLISIYTLTPEEQYLEIRNRCPDLLNMITLKELASYLMISPETLSRIRKKIVST